MLVVNQIRFNSSFPTHLPRSTMGRKDGYAQTICSILGYAPDRLHVHPYARAQLIKGESFVMSRQGLRRINHSIFSTNPQFNPSQNQSNISS